MRPGRLAHDARLLHEKPTDATRSPERALAARSERQTMRPTAQTTGKPIEAGGAMCAWSIGPKYVHALTQRAERTRPTWVDQSQPRAEVR
jgi:hypothetical protein